MWTMALKPEAFSPPLPANPLTRFSIPRMSSDLRVLEEPLRSGLILSSGEAGPLEVAEGGLSLLLLLAAIEWKAELKWLDKLELVVIAGGVRGVDEVGRE